MNFKHLAIAALLAVGAVAGFAGDRVKLEFNFYDSDAEIVPVGELPDGVSLGKKVPFQDKKLYGFATPLMIHLDKASKLDLKFVIKGKAGRIKPSVFPCRRQDGVKPVIEVLEFVFCGTSCAKTPFKCTGWTGTGICIDVDDGETVTLKAEFKAPAE